MKHNRRHFMKRSGQLALGMGLSAGFAASLTGCNNKTETTDQTQTQQQGESELFFKISLAQWSLHKALGFNAEKTMDNLDFAAKARNDFGIEAVEYVNAFFKDKAEDMAYLGQMKQRAEDNGVKSLLIMVDGEGGLGTIDDAERTKAIENHYKWVGAAKFLGCHSIRVNAYGEGKRDDVAKAAVDSLSRLSEYAAIENINVIVENHGGYSSDGNWMAKVIKEVGMANCGMLPDFGNFCVRYDNPTDYENRKCLEMFDRYEGVKLFMPYAKAVSAKTHDFDENGNEIHTDYLKMMQIVKDAGYTGYVGVEYEGNGVSEEEGIRLTKALLEKVGKELS